MDQRLTIITLGVSTLEASERFYSHVFGWKKSEQSNASITFYDLNGFQLALYPTDSLADDAGVGSSSEGWRGVTLAYNTRSKEEVDRLFEYFVQQGVEVVKPPQKTFWGGYSGYIADPDNHLWEIAFNPFLALDSHGNIVSNPS